MRNQYVNSDPMVQELTRNIVQLERDLITTKQTLKPQNPALVQQQEILDAFQSRLEDRREEVTKDFDDTASQEINKVRNDRVLNVQTELEQMKVHENHIREVLAEEDTQVIEIGRKQLAIQDLQFERDLDQQIYDTVCRRIQDLEMKGKRPARVTVGYNADIVSFQDKRVKYTMALAFGAIACGMLLAFLRDKADLSLHTPDDVAKRIGIRIIGTTASTHFVKPSLLPAQIVGDYQTIRANLQLLDGGGMPKKLVITSSAMREGKTTFAINLATSLSKAGKKVLLIDGDLRKPDIARFLNLPNGSRGLQDMLFGRPFSQAVYAVDSGGLDVLAADSRNALDAYELIASPLTAEHINTISQSYDHVIIDTPPVLAFPDTLLWAKMAGAAILTSFAGHTTSADLMEAKQRLTQIDVTVLGTVLHNVRVDQSYHRYGYSYYTSKHRAAKHAKQLSTNLSLFM
jgi:capsular exopolysaccharide synthesis family protein